MSSGKSKIEMMSQRITELNELINEIEEDKKRLKNKICMSGNQSDVKQTSRDNTSELNNIKYLDKCTEEDSLTDELADTKSELEKLIDQIPNARHRRILKCVYIDNMSIKDVANNIGYNYKYLSGQLLPEIIKTSDLI